MNRRQNPNPRSQRTRLYRMIGVILAIALVILIILVAVLVSQKSQQTQQPTPTQQPAQTQPPIPTQQPTATQQPAGGTALNGIAIKGNQFVTDSGQSIVLRGVNYAGLDFPCSHDQGLSFAPLTASAVEALVSWHVNVARIGIPEDCWLGINDLSPQWSGTKYQQAVIHFVNLLHMYKIYVELSLFYVAPGSNVSVMQLSMPDADHALDFWTSLATTFKNDRNVIFGAYGEPHPDNWSCWKNGGSSCPLSYLAIGMQQIVNTIRATGATQPIAISGIGWANNLSQWLTYKPSDPLNSLAAEFDVYSENPCSNITCWNAEELPVLQQVPLLTGEIGEHVSDPACGNTFLNTFLTWADAHNVNYEVWKWGVDTRDTPCTNDALITSYEGAPSPLYGEAFKAHLASLANDTLSSQSISQRPYTKGNSSFTTNNISKVYVALPAYQSDLSERNRKLLN